MVDNKSNKSVGTSHSCKSCRSEISVAEEELERLQFIKEQNEHAREEERRIFELQQRIRRMKTSSEPARSRPGSSCGDNREDERHPRPHSFNMCSNWIATSVEPHHKSGNLDPQVSRESGVNVTAGPVHFAVNTAIVPETPLPKWSTPVNPVINGANIAQGKLPITPLTTIPEPNVNLLTRSNLHPTATPFVNINRVPCCHTSGHDFTSHPTPSRPLNMDEVAQMVCAMNQSVLTQQEQARISLLPPVKLERFDGDFSKFTQFCRTFEWNVESNTNDPRRRLTQLYNQLDGPPKDLIEGCLHLPPDHGYDEAWRMLREEYENSSELFESFISKLFAWKDIEVGDAGLKKYGSYLFNVEMALGDNICRMELRETISKIVDQARVAEEIRYIEAGRGKPSHTTNKPIIIRKPVNSLNVHALDMNAMDMTPSHGHRFCNDKKQCDRCGAYYHHTLLDRPIAKSFAPSRKYKRSPTGSVKVFSNENIPDCYEKLGTPSSSTGGGIEAKGSVTPNVNSPLTDALPCAKILDCEPDGRIMMKILPVRVNNSVSTYAFIDGGAAPTLAARSLIQRLGIQGLPVRQAMKTENGIFMCNKRIPLMLSSTGGGNNITVNEVYIIDKLSITTDSMMPVNWTKKWLHLNDVDLQRLPGDNQEVEIIIGLNSILNRHILDQIHGTDDEPSAYLTRFGRVVFGPTGPRNPLPAPVYHISPTQDLCECLREHFNADFWEKEVHSQREDSLEDKLFSDKISQSIHQESGKYVVKLPLRDSSPLPNNREMAVRRMKSLKRKLESDKTFKETYITQMEKNISKQYAEIVPPSGLERNDGRIWYMPHHAVRHPTKLKVRVVYDLKAKFNGTSLNDHLLQGPDLTNPLIGVLMRFRHGHYAVTADIEEMFYQVKVPLEDRDVFCFLWWPDGDINKPVSDYRMNVHVSGARSSPSCVNYALRKTAEDHGEVFDEQAVTAIIQSFYADNLLLAHDDKERLIKIIKDLIALCNAGGWRLNQWTANNKDVLKKIPESERDASVASLDLSKDDLPVERTLGVHWSMAEDCFTFKICLGDKPLTRRGVLSIVASIYDPLGMVAPLTLPAKMILQDMCQMQLGWDENMGDKEAARWRKWLEQLPKLSRFKLPRSLVPISFGSIISYQLHHFADASQSGYGTASYLKMVNASERVYCTLVMARARVAPLKPTTIPRLELTAAIVAARMDCKLRKELGLKLEDSVFWTDSTSVLKYLFNQKARYHTFVANRVNLIRELSSASAWRYVDTKSNPADLASRGLDVDTFLTSEMWIRGPRFLHEPESSWPQVPEDVKHGSLEDDVEVKVSVMVCETVTTVMSFIEEFASRFSNWQKFVRCHAWVRRFLKRKYVPKLPDVDCLSSKEITDAETHIWKLVQQENYSSEIVSLSRKPDGRVQASSKIVRLRPFLQDGLLRVGGHLRHSGRDFNVTHPIILPNKSSFVKLMVRWHHEKLAHCGQNYLLSELRQKFWVVHANAVARSVVRSCMKCRAICARPMTQEMADLPGDRIIPGQPPFTHTGTDCFGPFLVRKGRSNLKRYGIVFTCLTSRAVHIEVMDSMETDSFINALRRFTARRGPVKSIRSDIGINLVGAEKVLRQVLQLLDQTAICDTMSTRGISWCFNPPHASHFGGVWERQIRSIRHVLSGICYQQTLTDDSLHTLFCEVEAIINGRPLTRVTDDPDCLQPLTPSMLLNLKGSPGPVMNTDNKNLYARRRWKQVQYLADLFWKRWSKEYLPLLQERQKWNIKRRDVKKGDIVLTLDERLPRGTWPLARVIEVMCDSDGQLRSAKLKTVSGEYIRPISKMCLLLENEINTEN
ncbi:uncharacterized protein [Penaeus vannamei]|uniref:uncharacterized protein n=1 Tax=Penaeus vannamei TaxID=6689 RepID=UPI00387F9CB6